MVDKEIYDKLGKVDFIAAAARKTGSGDCCIIVICKRKLHWSFLLFGFINE